jgi:hypothetical protein
VIQHLVFSAATLSFHESHISPIMINFLRASAKAIRSHHRRSQDNLPYNQDNRPYNRVHPALCGSRLRYSNTCLQPSTRREPGHNIWVSPSSLILRISQSFRASQSSGFASVKTSLRRRFSQCSTVHRSTSTKRPP